MNDDQSKALKKLLKGEFVPLFVGLRNELKKTNEALEKLIEKEPPEIQKAEVTNHPDPLEQIEVSNLPEVQKAEIVNFPEHQREVEVRGIGAFFSNLAISLVESIKNANSAVLSEIGAIKSHLWQVEVTNQTAYPSSMRISNPEDFKQEPPVIPSRIFIENSEPQDAIPVVLTTHDRKKFYETMMQVIAGNDIDLTRVKALLEDIKENTANIVINADTVNVNVDELEELTGKTLRQAYGEAAVLSSTETTLASFIVPVGKTLRIKGTFGEGDDDGIFRLYIDSSKKWQARNSWAERNVQGIIEVEASTGATVAIKVFNTRATTKSYTGSFYGYEL